MKDLDVGMKWDGAQEKSYSNYTVMAINSKVTTRKVYS